MLHKKDWSFSKSQKEAALLNYNVEGRFGFSVNKGETEPSMIEILVSWKGAPALVRNCLLLDRKLTVELGKETVTLVQKIRARYNAKKDCEI